MIIFDIKRYAINDGPGIRTTLFLKGCPLRCVWCHNPESWHSGPELMFKQKKCIGCNSCGIHPRQLEYLRTQRTYGAHETYDTDRYPTSNAEEIASRCPALALEMCGREWTMSELMAEVEKERDIMVDSGGGVTLCGGEPLMHHGDALEILRELGLRDLHRAVDTSLYAEPDIVGTIDSETDLFLIDLKVMDSVLHRQYTGVPNDVILNNIRMLARKWASEGKPLAGRCWFRIPLIEGINADPQNIEATAKFIQALPSADSNPPSVSLLPYHDVGKDKHHRRGSCYNPDSIQMSTPSDQVLERCIHQFASYGITAKIGG
ncbi:MAG: glycyl-radical enzyme activating protein [Bacteroidaceae bacterium]|nr:glycyl-radical enzyme activating protein [Bacteroidaceae bacterium]